MIISTPLSSVFSPAANTSSSARYPPPREADLARGILEAIDMESYRVEKKAALALVLPDADLEISPVPTAAGGHKAEPELERLSSILREFTYLEVQRVLGRVMTGLMRDDTELFRRFSDVEGFRRWLTDWMFELTYA